MEINMENRMGVDQFAELMAGLVRNFPRDLPTEVAQYWVDHPYELGTVLRAVPGKKTEEVPPQPVTRPPLVGRVVKKIVVPAYSAADFAEAVRLGKFDNDTGETVRQFAEERVGLATPAKVDLVEFDRNWWNDEALAWGMANGNKKPIETAHTMGIAIKLPNEQRERPIVELGSVRHGYVLCLFGGSIWRHLSRDAVEGGWGRDYLVGFVSE